MNIIRTCHNKSNPYVILSKKTLENSSLTMEARGLWAYLMSRPDDWRISIQHLCKVFPNGERSIRRAIKELVDNKLCHYQQQKSTFENGKSKWGSVAYTIFETPEHCEQFQKSFAHCSFAHTQKRNAYYIKKEELNNKKEKEKKEKSPIPITTEPFPHTDPPKPAASPPSPEAQGLASFIFEKIKIRVPKAKPPNLTTWAKQLDREMKKNGWTVEELKKVVEFGWTQTNTWWHILSPTGLFNRYTEAINKMKTPYSAAEEKQKKEDAEREQQHRNRAWLQKASDHLRDELKKNNMRINNLWWDHTELMINEKKYCFYFNNSNFKEQFIEKLGETAMREYLVKTPVGKKVLIKN